MKKYLYYCIAACAAMALGTSCSSEEPAPAAGDGGNVTVSVQLPGELNSRYGDGLTATELHYAVYVSGQENPAPLAVCIQKDGSKGTEGYATMTDLKTDISLQLTTGKSYDLVFWADAPGDNVYTFHADNQTVTADYTGVKANSEALDAFFANQTVAVNGPTNVSVVLKRPFAQLNVVTNDLTESAAAGFTATQTKVALTMPTALHLGTGIVTDAKAVEFGYEDLAQGQIQIEGTKYDYMLMNYMLTSESKELYDVTFTVKSTEGEERAIALNSLPLQRNYRTNVYGSILTDGVNIHVEINPGFLKPDYEIDYDKTYVKAATSEELAAAAATPNAVIEMAENTTYTMPDKPADGVTFAGATGTVLDMSGMNGGHFSGVTFKNLTIKEDNGNYNGLIHTADLLYENCVLEGQHFLYADGITFNGCTFKQTSADAYNVWTYGAANVVFNNCKFESAGKAVLVYRENGTDWLKNSFNNCEFTATSPVAGKAAIEIDSSLAPYDVYINNCTATGFGNGSVSGNSLWNNKKGDSTNLKVTVDGVAQTL